jgi:outer membrane protein assembly factor BamB
MPQKGKKHRLFWILLGGGLGLLLVLGGMAGYSRLDLEHHERDPQRTARLAATELPAPSLGLAGAGDWPQWRGPNRDGFSPETDLARTWPAEGPPIVWKKPIGRGFSSMAVAGARLFTMDQTPGETATESVVCLSAETGDELWRFRYPCVFEERFGSGPRSTPAVDDGLVYAVGPTGVFHCLRADTGDKVWRRDLGQEFPAKPTQYGVSFSPLVEGDLVYAMPGAQAGNSVVAFDKRSGALVWKALDDPTAYSSPVAATIAGVRQLLVFTNSALVSLSPHDGAVYWRFPWKTEGGFNIATPLVFGDYVFISSGYGKGCALLEIAAGPDGSLRADRVYEHNRMRNHFASSVRVGDDLYGFDQTDLVCMDARTGEIRWREKGFRKFGKGNLLAADGRLILLGEPGVLALAEASPAGYHETASFQASRNKCWTVPALARGKLYLRDESEIVCYDLRKPGG